MVLLRFIHAGFPERDQNINIYFCITNGATSLLHFKLLLNSKHKLFESSSPSKALKSVTEPRTLSGRLFQSLGAKYEKAQPPLVDFAILGTTKSPEFCDIRERVGL